MARVATLAALLLDGCALGPLVTMAPPAPVAVLAPGDTFRDCAECPEMVVIPPGRFFMGSPDTDSERWSAAREGPQHAVVIERPFALGRHEVTRAQYAAFVSDTGRSTAGCYHWTGEAWLHDEALDWRHPGFAQGDDEPVVCVAWADAVAYARWLSVKTGRPYRLPSEAEWEYAARAGTTTRRFWGDDIDAGCRYGNLGDRSIQRGLGLQPFADCDDGYVRTAPVGRFLPNAFGLYDMLGNVWEWTADCWREGYDGAPTDGAARITEPCLQRVNRGAGWNSHPRNVRVSNRGNYAPAPYETVGFRVAR
jgi:formylglycine-generating enzyme required for sulfatase activity